MPLAELTAPLLDLFELQMRQLEDGPELPSLVVGLLRTGRRESEKSADEA